MKFLTQVKRISIASIIVSVILGILFIAFPEKCITYFSLAIGISLIILGVVSIIGYFIDKSGGFTLALGIISAIVGIIICVKYQAIISLIVVLFGIFILASGIFNFFTAIKVIASSVVFGWVTLGLSILTSVFGIIAITKSGELTITIVQFIGAALLIYAVMDTISFIQVKKLVKEVKTAVDATNDIETDAVIVEQTDDDVESKAEKIEEIFNVPAEETVVEDAPTETEE
ncbi:MAG: DUF308 domain-containing protein [Eubacterium sp.]|nr:DUF308 domain-containing protein [Eubacterium sp.]